MIRIEGTPKEIAALVLELQGRQEESSMEAIERMLGLENNVPKPCTEGVAILRSSSDCKRPFSERMARSDGECP